MKLQKYLPYVGGVLVVGIIQVITVRLINIEGITPDLILIYLLYLTFSEGQIAGTVFGFFTGLVFDFAVGGFLGLTALTKTVSCFLAGYLYNENKTLIILGGFQFVTITFFISLIHNALYFAIFTAGTELHFIRTLLIYGLGTSLYTAVLALVPMFIFSRRISVE